MIESERIKNLNNKHDALKLAAKDFPYLSRKANHLRINLTIEIKNLEVYKDVLQTLKN